MGAMCNVDKTTNRFDVDFEKVVSFCLKNTPNFDFKQPNIMRSNRPEDKQFHQKVQHPDVEQQVL